jgi:hypothetical protein
MTPSRQAQVQQIADFIRSYVNEQMRKPPQGVIIPVHSGRLGSASPEELAKEFLELAEFQALRLGTWLSTPEGEIITQAVELALGPTYRADAQLLVAALQLAAGKQQRREQKRLVAVGGIGLLVLIFLGGGGE